MKEVVAKAKLIAEVAHFTQRRKYTSEPYVEHCRRVVSLLDGSEKRMSDAAYAAAWLHDVVEDTPITLDFIAERCGMLVARYVSAMTDTKNMYMNRAARKEVDRKRLSESNREVQTIKVCDLIDNTESIVQYDPAFAKVYLKEKQLLLDVLTKADKSLHERAQHQLTQALEAME